MIINGKTAIQRLKEWETKERDNGLIDVKITIGDLNTTNEDAAQSILNMIEAEQRGDYITIASFNNN